VNLSTVLNRQQALFNKRATVVDVTDKKSSAFSKTVSTTVAPSKTSVAAARTPSPSSKT
jgi:hypothetical protein